MTIARDRQPEMMDRPGVDPVELRRGLADLREVNRWLGGSRSATKRVLDIARRVPTLPVRILDVATGSADVPLALVAAARRKGIAVEVTGIDLHPETVAAAIDAIRGEPEIEIMTGDAVALPFADAAFDIAMCNTTLHHFSNDDAIRVVAEMARVARWGIVLTDLSRSRLALLGARILAVTIWNTHPVTRHDGPASVRAAFTPGEVGQIVSGATGMPARTRREFLFRLSAVVDRTEAGMRSNG